jgi:hypothetical protein
MDRWIDSKRESERDERVCECVREWRETEREAERKREEVRKIKPRDTFMHIDKVRCCAVHIVEYSQPTSSDSSDVFSCSASASAVAPSARM